MLKLSLDAPHSGSDTRFAVVSLSIAALGFPPRRDGRVGDPVGGRVEFEPLPLPTAIAGPFGTVGAAHLHLDSVERTQFGVAFLAMNPQVPTVVSRESRIGYIAAVPVEVSPTQHLDGIILVRTVHRHPAP